MAVRDKIWGLGTWREQAGVGAGVSAMPTTRKLRCHTCYTSSKVTRKLTGTWKRWGRGYLNDSFTKNSKTWVTVSCKKKKQPLSIKFQKLFKLVKTLKDPMWSWVSSRNFQIWKIFPYFGTFASVLEGPVNSLESQNSGLLLLLFPSLNGFIEM